MKLPSRLGDAAGALKDVTVGVFAGATKLLIVLTVVFLLLLDGPRFVAFGLRLGGPAREARYRSVAVDIYRAVSGYVTGNLVISLIAGTVTYVTLTILGVPFAVPLAVLMAFLDLIPLIGATIGGIVIGLITLFSCGGRGDRPARVVAPAWGGAPGRAARRPRPAAREVVPERPVLGKATRRAAADPE